jgi:uncharacterized repeat protein (TIGR02543 family)
MKKLLGTLLFVALWMFSTILIAVPIARCEDGDPVHIYYAGNKISNPDGPIVWTGPCNTQSFTFTVTIQWDSPPAINKNVKWANVGMTEISSYGITFVPLTTTLYNSLYSPPLGPDHIDVLVTVPTAGLPAGTYNANIYADVTAQGPAQTPNVAGTNGYFQFVKTVCPPPQATISGVKFHDKNANGIWDDGEEGLSNWYIQLFKKVGDEWASVDAMLTGGIGDYDFTVSTAGHYEVTEVSQDGWRQTASPPEFDVALGDVITGKDFGNVRQYTLTVVSLYDTPGGGGLYDEGTTAYATLVTGTVELVPGAKQAVFTGWTGDASGAGLTSNPITMDGDKTATAEWQIQYYLTVQIDPSGLTPAPTPASNWYEENTDATENAGTVTGYIFVNWDVDGGNVAGNPISVHMDTWHTATAHYWLELGFECFITDSSFNVITRFDTVWAPKDLSKTTFKLASTNPGQFMYNIKITNTWPVAMGPLTISYGIDDDFILKGADPIQVWTGYGKTGTRISATVTYGLTGTVTISNIDPGATLYVTIHMEYGPARGYYDKATMLAWKSLGHRFNTFTCGYTVTVPGPFPFVITHECSTTIEDPIVVLGLEE